MPDQLAWFAIGALFGLLLCGWPWHPRFSRYGRRTKPPVQPFAADLIRYMNWQNEQMRLAIKDDWRRSFTHENLNKPTGEPPLKLRRSIRLNPGSVQRGNSNGGPSTPKPRIILKPQFPQPRTIREDFLL
jgi:hypothetical protein